MEHRLDPWLVLGVLGILGASLIQLSVLDRVLGGRLLLRQAIWGAIGLVVLWIVSRIRTSTLLRLAVPAYAGSILLLVAVLAFGETRSGTRGWFAAGPFTFQPSELARLGTVLVLALWFANRTGEVLSVRGFLALSALAGLPVGLILLEPDLGVALTYLPLWGAVLWLAGLPGKAWATLVVLVVLGAAGAWTWGLKPYQKERVLTVLDPSRDPYGAGYQVRQSKIAIGSGMATGRGFGRGPQSLLRFLPAQHTDFIFATWGEATGFVGSSILLGIYALLLWRILLAALHATTRFGLALATMIGAWIAFQVVVNLGMVVGWLPTTGITLPLFSYGGSSLLTTCAALGLVISVGRERLVNL